MYYVMYGTNALLFGTYGSEREADSACDYLESKGWDCWICSEEEYLTEWA